MSSESKSVTIRCPKQYCGGRLMQDEAELFCILCSDRYEKMGKRWVRMGRPAPQEEESDTREDN